MENTLVEETIKTVSKKKQKQQPVVADFLMHSHSKGKTRRYTLAAIIKDGAMSIGYSICSEKDNFTKVRGREISTVRASKWPVMVTPAGRTTEDNKTIFRQLFKEFPAKNNTLFVKPNYKYI